MSLEPESSPTKGEASGHEYEVFLSFMGGDTRKGFTDHLYHRMKDAGISVFKDSVNLPDGQEIGHGLSEGIKKSKIAMPILSMNYAASGWCLDELAFMLECKNTRKQMVLPIFYDVIPSQVRQQTGSYATAFVEHVKKYEKETVDKWRRALAEVASLKGLELEKETGGHEGQLTKLIVAKVLSELKKAHLLVTNYLVGMEYHTKSVMELLHMSEKAVRTVGIWGMGGIGKTTLAKFIYNYILDEFECFSFLNDIREKSLEHKGLEGLQTQLVFDLSKEARRNFTSVDEGVNELKHRFREKKVLILLDDVDQIHQLYALAAEVGWFGPGSRIIITTRTRDVLDVHQESEVYEVLGMDQENALQLFCKHAFRQDSPMAEFELLSNAIVETTGGLPLALEVVGSFLSRKRKSIWEETLKELRRMPKQEVQERLKISYERLDDDQKQMFLDVACLFIGEDIDVVVHVWKDRKFSAEIGKDVLLVMSLIRIGEDNKIGMHDQLRDLGREIVRKENCKEPGKRSRLWQEDEARDVLVNCVAHGSCEVEALHLHGNFRSYNCITNKQLRNFPNIWFLKLHRVNLKGDFQHLLPKLRWFVWQEFSHTCTPTNLPLEKLLVLDLSFSKIGNDWKLWRSFQSAKKLKVLNLSYCTGLRILNVSMFINLERLILDNCFGLKEISIGKRENLIFLSMKNCWFIKELTDSIGKLKSLRELDLSGASFRLPSSISVLEKLLVLDLSFSKIVNDSEFWRSFQSAKKLKVLNLSYCTGLSILNVSMFINLERLILDNCFELKEISIGKLENLIFLSMKNCWSIKELPDSIGKLKSLRELDLSGTSFPLPSSISDLEELEVLKIVNRGTILEFGKLRIIDVFVCEGLKGNIFNEKWTIGVRIYLKMIKNLNGSEALHELKLSGGRDYQQSKTQQLRGSLKGVEALELLHVIGCGSIENLPISCNLKFLVRLDLDNCEKLQQVEDLDKLEALQELNIRYCGEIKTLPSLFKLKSLRVLNCSYCWKLQELEILDGLAGLEELHVKVCGSIERLPNLSKLKSLKILNCSWCGKLQELEGLDGLEVLEKLDVRWCSEIKKLPSLCKLKLLRSFYCCGCEMLQEVEGLNRLDALEFVSISGCKAITHIPSLPQKMKSKLSWLNLWGCEDYKRIHQDPELGRFCSICQLGAEDVCRLHISAVEDELL